MLGRGDAGLLLRVFPRPAYIFFFLICSPLSMSPLREWAERAHGFKGRSLDIHKETDVLSDAIVRRQQSREKEKRVETIYDRRTILSALRHVMRNH